MAWARVRFHSQSSIGEGRIHFDLEFRYSMSQEKFIDSPKLVGWNSIFKPFETTKLALGLINAALEESERSQARSGEHRRRK